LLRLIEEFQKYVLVTGFRKVRIDAPEEFLKLTSSGDSSNVEVQVFDAEDIATWEHLYFAVLNALMSFRNKTSISRSLAMETMLYASAQRQIRRAIGSLGVKHGSTKIAMILIGVRAGNLRRVLSKVSKQIKAERDETVLKLTNEKMANIRRIFNVTDDELSTVKKGNGTKKALVDLIIERMALLATER
jgi:tRNA threonylcarbamoyladenosine modification (KEOPS) complex Cgi121 subunit